MSASEAAVEEGEAWCWASAQEIARSVRAGEVSAVEITRAHLARIARVDGRLGSYLIVDREGALAQAAAVDVAVAEGRDPGRLAGVPVGLKDLLVTAGLRTTAGSRILGDWIPPYDATVVARLRAAGAVILGKLNLDEFAMGSSNERSAFFACRNPWDLSRVPGGSSGGSAAAVAAGLCSIALGTDTGGSIRQPAALSGCVGIKPTYGRVSRWGAIAFASSLDQIGPLARTVEDCALALEVIGGFDALDATSIEGEMTGLVAACEGGGAGSSASATTTTTTSTTTSTSTSTSTGTGAVSGGALAGLRVGVPEELFGEGLDPAVERLVRAAIGRLETLGAKTVAVSLPHARHALAAYYLIAPAEASSNLARYDGVRYGIRESGAGLADTYARTRAAGFGDEVKRRIMLGTYALRAGYYDAYYLKAQKVRALIAADYARAFEVCDVLAAPTSPIVAFPLGARSSGASDPLAMYLADVCTISCNLAGLPGLSVPCGFAVDPTGPSGPSGSSSGGGVALPVGLQLIGPPLGEAVILFAATQYQRATDWHLRRPTAVEQGVAGDGVSAAEAASDRGAR